VRRFSALVQADNSASLGLLASAGETQRRWDTGVVELVVELPPKRGMGARLGQALRAAAAGTLVPAKTLADRVAIAVDSSPRPPVQADRPIRTIVVGSDDSDAEATTLAVALGLGAILGAAVHVVGVYGILEQPEGAQAALARAADAARAQGLEAVTHVRRDDRAEALMAVAKEHDADLLVVSNAGMSVVTRPLVGSVANKVSHHMPCSVLIVWTETG
jgi:nucleotide-binding universal stress UspA family protein